MPDSSLRSTAAYESITSFLDDMRSISPNTDPAALDAMRSELLKAALLFASGVNEPFEEPPTSRQPAASSLEPTPAVRFKTTPSHSSEPVPEKNRFCSGKTKAGRECRAFARLDTAFCIFHDPAYAEDLRQSARSGGQRSVESRRTRPEPVIPIDIRTPENRADVLGYMISAIIQGKMPHSSATSIARAMSIAMQDKDDFRFDMSALLRP